MPLARLGRVILYFAHIPKTGGSSIERYLSEVGEICLVARRPTGFSTVTPQHMERDTFAQYVPDGFYDHGFAILRDPQDRLISEFRHQDKVGKPHDKVMHHLKPAGPARRGAVAGGAEGFVWKNDFDGWARAILLACDDDPYICDNHIRPQSDFVQPGHRLFDFAAGLDPVIRWIDEVAGLTPLAGPIPHEKRALKRPVAVSAETSRLIERFYRDDYALLREVSANRA